MKNQATTIAAIVAERLRIMSIAFHQSSRHHHVFDDCLVDICIENQEALEKAKELFNA